MIANCGALGVDWNGLSLSGYFEAMNAESAEQAPVEISPGLRAFMAQHGVIGNA